MHTGASPKLGLGLILGCFYTGARVFIPNLAVCTVVRTGKRSCGERSREAECDKQSKYQLHRVPLLRETCRKPAEFTVREPRGKWTTEWRRTWYLLWLQLRPRRKNIPANPARSPSKPGFLFFGAILDKSWCGPGSPLPGFIREHPHGRPRPKEPTTLHLCLAGNGHPCSRADLRLSPDMKLGAFAS